MAKLSVVLTTLLRGNLHQFLATFSSARQSGGLLIFGGALYYGWNAFQVPLAEAAFRLPLGETGLIQPMFAALFYAWLLVPLLLRGGGLDLAAIKRLRRFPFNRPQSFVIALAEIFTAPLVWILLLPTLSLFASLAQAPYPAPAQTGYLLFALLSVLLMMTTNLLLLLAGLSLRKRRLLLFGFLGLALLLQAAPIDLQTYLPHQLLVRLIVTSEPLPLLRLLTVELLLALGAMLLSFSFLFHEMRCDSGDDPLPLLARKHAWLPTVRGRWGTFIQMSVLFYYKGVEPVLGLVSSFSACAYLLHQHQPEPRALFFAVSLVSLCHAGLFLNLFGHEEKGILRLHLLPLPGHHLLFLKNVSACLIALLSMLPLLLIAAFRIGPFPALLGSFVFLASILGLATWGNIVSVKDPAPRSYFASQRPLLSNMFTFLILAAWLGLMSLLVRHPGLGALASLSALTVGLFVAYRWSLQRAGALFEEQALAF